MGMYDNCGMTAISNIVKKYRNTGSFENKKRSGRPKLVSERLQKT